MARGVARLSLRRSIASSYASHAYVTLIGVVLIPVYLHYMGAENYGLVGFFLMLQGWFQLLDVGITPTVSRETARFKSGVGSASEFRWFVGLLEAVFFGIAVVVAVVFALSSPLIARGWLTFQELDVSDVVVALQLIGCLVSLRWACGLFRGMIAGFERLVWLAGFNAGIATLRFVFVVPVLAYIGAEAKHFFGYQIVVSLLELGLLIRASHRLLPTRSRLAADVRPNWRRLQGLFTFSLTIALTSSLSIVVTQLDKLALSRLIPLNDFGYFTAAALVAAGIAVMGAPIGTVLQPRLCGLAASGRDDEMLSIYRNATQVITLLAGPAVLLMVVFPEQILWVWSGNVEFARVGTPTLALYAIGNGIMALGALPFYLLFARGALRLHLVGSVLFAAAFVPLCIWGAAARGPTGTGLALITVSTAYLLLWVPRIHAAFGLTLHRRWLFEDILPIAASAATAVLLARLLIPLSTDRVQLGLQLAALSVATLIAAGGGSASVRRWLSARTRRSLDGDAAQ